LSDLDINQHVNNVNYIEWAIEAIPIKVIQRYQLSQFEISFRSESKYGDSVISNAQEFESKDQKTYLHGLVNSNTEVELTVARSIWNRK